MNTEYYLTPGEAVIRQNLVISRDDRNQIKIPSLPVEPPRPRRATDRSRPQAVETCVRCSPESVVGYDDTAKQATKDKCLSCGTAGAYLAWMAARNAEVAAQREWDDLVRQRNVIIKMRRAEDATMRAQDDPTNPELLAKAAKVSPQSKNPFSLLDVESSDGEEAEETKVTPPEATIVFGTIEVSPSPASSAPPESSWDSSEWVLSDDEEDEATFEDNVVEARLEDLAKGTPTQQISKSSSVCHCCGEGHCNCDVLALEWRTCGTCGFGFDSGYGDHCHLCVGGVPECAHTIDRFYEVGDKKYVGAYCWTSFLKPVFEEAYKASSGPTITVSQLRGILNEITRGNAKLRIDAVGPNLYHVEADEHGLAAETWCSGLNLLPGTAVFGMEVDDDETGPSTRSGQPRKPPKKKTKGKRRRDDSSVSGAERSSFGALKDHDDDDDDDDDEEPDDPRPPGNTPRNETQGGHYERWNFRAQTWASTTWIPSIELGRLLTNAEANGFKTVAGRQATITAYTQLLAQHRMESTFGRLQRFPGDYLQFVGTTKDEWPTLLRQFREALDFDNPDKHGGRNNAPRSYSQAAAGGNGGGQDEMISGSIDYKDAFHAFYMSIENMRNRMEMASGIYDQGRLENELNIQWTGRQQ